MGRPHPLELRSRVVAHVEAGKTHRSAAKRFDVSIKFVNDMVKLKRETGRLSPKRQGNVGIGKLTPHADWLRQQVEAKPEVTLGEIAARLEAERGLRVNPSSIWRLLRRLGLRHKKKTSRPSSKSAKT